VVVDGTIPLYIPAYEDDTMTQQEFEETIRECIWREPFQPFVVELLDGTIIDVDAPSVAMGGGEAGFITAEEDVIFFAHENVKTIRVPTRELSA